MAKITVQNTNITVINMDGKDYVSITDLARHRSDDPTAVIGNWMRNRNTLRD
ncbi:MAG: KilA-N domain-containing protein [Muribaculaceae bacterium]|nr:KilA-N domain-containing protein [Muribaculaceae bacterium]